MQLYSSVYDLRMTESPKLYKTNKLCLETNTRCYAYAGQAHHVTK